MSLLPHTRAPDQGLERVAGRYELIERLAQGGMGEVFVARELASGRKLALKRLLPIAHKRQALFRAEYHVLARLKHPHIIEVYEFGVDKDLPYYTMELLDGYDLREAPQVGFEENCRILRDVASSLALLHSQHLLHRDISPRNVRRTSSGVCKLLDFGTMVPFGLPPNLAGTPAFISPEAWEGGLLDQRSDLYQLGALAYWLFSRRLPGSARSLDRPPSPREKVPLLSKVARDIPPALEELVMSLLEFDPSKRPVSAVEVIARLSALAKLPADDSAILAQSHLVSSRVVGQKRCLAKTEKLLGRALVCNGGGALIQGAPGSGKTRLLQEVSLQAQTRGFSVVRAFGGRAERGIAIARELYRGLRRAAPEALELLSVRDREALLSFDRQEAGTQAAQPAEQRAQLQWALAAYFRLVAKSAPWLVLVDDLDLADEFSAALVAALAAMAETLPLLVVASAQAGASRSETPLAAFAGRAKRMQLSDLDEKHTRQLVTNVFGRVPNRERLVSFLFREAHGNPALTMELCRYLLERGVIRYVDGSFVLPESEIHEELPVGTALAYSLRLSGLGPTARDLVDLIATCRGGASLELCLSASSVSGEDVIRGVNELVSRGVLMGSGRDYVIAQEALRSGISLAIPPAEKQQLHERLARAYLGTPNAAPLHKLEAAWHMVHTEREEREGAELLARITPRLIEDGVAYHAAVEGLEKALEVLERLGAPLAERLAIRVHLARASYLYDYRLANRYAAETLRALYEWTGMPIAERFRRVLGQTGSFLLCIVIMSFRYVFYSKQRRGPLPITSFMYLGRTLLSTLGVRMTALDREAAVSLLRYIWVFRDTPRLSPSRAAYLTAEALAVQPFGREAELAQKLALARDALERKLPLMDMTEAERQDMRVGLLLSGGINECYRVGSRALARADEMAAMGTRIAQAAAHRIRFTYYMVRGMREKAEEFRRELDIHGIQGGTTWQVDWFAVPTEGMASALLGDVVGTAQALARLERLAEDMPSLVPLREMVRIGHHMRRGETAQAIELGAAFVAAFPPRSVIGWGTGYAAYAAALNQEGRHAEAQALCERALAVLGPEDLEYVIMYGALERELAFARAGAGDPGAANVLAGAYIAKLEAHGEIALVAHAHECRVRVARMLHDQRGLMDALVAMREAAERTASTTVIEQAAKVTQASLRATRELELGPFREEIGDSDGTVGEETPAGGVARARKRTLLRRVMERSRARSAFALTFSDNDGGPRLVTSAGEPLSAPAVLAAVRTLLASLEEADSERSVDLRERIEIEGRWFEVSTLPRARQEDSNVLMLLETAEISQEDIPPTLLARLAEGVRSELSLSQESGDSVSDSDLSQTFG